jgi:hypothetical protein
MGNVFMPGVAGLCRFESTELGLVRHDLKKLLDGSAGQRLAFSPGKRLG